MGNNTNKKPMTVTAAASPGVGSIIGAGIFAPMGEASSIAGSAVWLPFIAGGLIALVSGYSLAKLGACYPAAGGIVDYLADVPGDNLRQWSGQVADEWLPAPWLSRGCGFAVKAVI